MNDLILQIFFFAGCCLIYFVSAKMYYANKIQNAVILILLAGLILRIFTSCDFYLHHWDERYHALVAKNMISHPMVPTLYNDPILPFNYQEWYNSNIFVHKQPLPLWLMAGSMSVFGVNEIAMRLPGILLSTLAIFLTFQIGKYFFNEKVGYIAAFLQSINGLVIELAAGRVATDHYDSYFLFFIELAIFLSIKFAVTQKIVFNIFAGIAIGFAILTKWLPALIVFPIWLLILQNSGNFTFKKLTAHFLVLSFICVITFLPWQIYIAQMWPLETAFEKSFNRMHITQVLDGRGGAWWYFIDRIRINYGELIYIPIIWFIYQLTKKIKDRKMLALFIWAFVPIIFFSLVKTKMQGYILFVSPALFIITGSFIYQFSQVQFNSSKKYFQYIIIATMLLLPFRYMLERTKLFSSKDRSPVWVSELKNLDEKNLENGVLFNYSRPIEAMFYTNLTAYPQLPDINLILELQTKGYKILINDNGSIPPEMLNLKGIIIKKIKTPDSN